MKNPIAIAVATCLLATWVSAEPPAATATVPRAASRPVTAPSLGTIPQLKAQRTKLTLQKIKVTAVAPPTTGTASGTAASTATTLPSGAPPNPSAAYRQGSGVVIKPNALYEPTTRSWGELYFAALRHGGDSSFARIEYLSWLHDYGNFAFVNTTFQNLPSGLHPYMVTVGISNAASGNTAQGQLYLNIAGAQVPPAAQLVSNGVIRTLISYDATGGRALPIEVGFGATSRGWIVQNVYYVQVAQLD